METLQQKLSVGGVQRSSCKQVGLFSLSNEITLTSLLMVVTMHQIDSLLLRSCWIQVTKPAAAGIICVGGQSDDQGW